MPSIDAALISSNWKILQARLKAGENGDKGLKRKRVNKDDSTTVTKRPRPEKPTLQPRSRRRDMGNMSSTEPSSSTMQKEAVVDLQQKHDISSADIGAAYGGFLQLGDKDIINGGRHKAHKCGRYLALDCEMVGAGPPPYRDDVLARVSIVNFHGEQIYDSYVQAPPRIVVKDYRTRYSGIEEEHMRPDVARPFAEVQKEVAGLIEGNILIGHAVYNDLRALQLNHSKRDTRDTSLHRAYKAVTKSRSPALRNLAQTFLGITIQESSHNSLEDARATMLLYKRDKKAFEDYSRKNYGAPRPIHRPATAPGEEQSEDGFGEEDLLEGEEDEVDEEDRISSPKPKKKSKKKKRTKR